MNVTDITITSLEMITGFDIVTGDYLFTLDELQNATISQAQDRVDVTGKNGRILNSLKRNKSVTISGTNGMLSGGLLELQTGNKFENKATEVMWTDYIAVTAADEAETTYTATGTAGDEIEAIYVKSAQGVLGEKFTQGAAVGPNVFTYDPATKKVQFETGAITQGSELVAYYKRKIVANVLTNMSDKYSEKCALYIDAFAEDKCANIFRVQFFIPKADFNGEFDIEMSDTQVVHAFEAESLAGACGADGALWTYTIFGANAEDAP